MLILEHLRKLKQLRNNDDKRRVRVRYIYSSFLLVSDTISFMKGVIKMVLYVLGIIGVGFTVLGGILTGIVSLVKAIKNKEP